MQNNEILYHERFRPQYHFTAPQGWLNDPNGLLYYQGEYHMFYQYNPHDIRWGDPYWGHAVSQDMIHWEHLPIALEPDALGSIFSGTIVVDAGNTSGFFGEEGGLVAFFTHHTDSEEYQSMAYSVDRGRTWTKYANNPVLRGGGGVAWKDFRDPKVLRYHDIWLMIVGGGLYRFYQSEDLINWTLKSEMAVFEEFPDLFQLQGSWVLNVNGYEYYTGLMTAQGFQPAQPSRAADFGNSWQACYTFENMPDDRCVWIAWMRDSAKGPTAPWRCSMSVPRDLRLVTCGQHKQIVQWPVKELDTLRTPYFECADVPVSECDLSAVRGQCLDIEVEFEVLSQEPFGIRCLAHDGRYTEIGCHPAENLIYTDTRVAHAEAYDDCLTMFAPKMSAIGNQTTVLGKLYTAFCPVSQTMNIRILLDNSTVEAFFEGGKEVCTTNVYPEPKADGISLFGSGQRIRSLRVYRMNSIWKSTEKAMV